MHQQALGRLSLGARSLKGQALQDCDRLRATIDQLLGLIATFERWNEELNRLLLHNREMQSKNDEFASIVNQAAKARSRNKANPRSDPRGLAYLRRLLGGR